MLFANNQEFAEAIKELREALKINPNQPEVYRSLDTLFASCRPQ